MTTPLGGLPQLPATASAAWSGWFSLAQQILQATSSSGPTTARPTTNLYVGQFYFDTTLGFPVWCSAPGSSPTWVNSQGMVS
jgi:hypothetical protein